MVTHLFQIDVTDTFDDFRILNYGRILRNEEKKNSELFRCGSGSLVVANFGYVSDRQ